MLKGFDCSNIGWIVGGGEEAELFHGGQELVIDDLRCVERPGMDGFEADSANLREAGERLAWTSYLIDALADSGRIIGTLPARLAYALDAALCQAGLARHVQNAELERGASDIWDQTLHGILRLILD